MPRSAKVFGVYSLKGFPEVIHHIVRYTASRLHDGESFSLNVLPTKPGKDAPWGFYSYELQFIHMGLAPLPYFLTALSQALQDSSSSFTYTGINGAGNGRGDCD